MLNVSIVIPVYNGEKSIARLVDELMAEIGGKFNLEIVLVNDCSPDDSEQICIEIFEKYPANAKFYSLAKNVGEHNAVMAGLNQITGDFVVIMDDDFQNPINEVEKLVAHADEYDCDVVYTYYDKKEHSFFRNFGSTFNDRVANLMLKKPKDLYLSSFKLIKKWLVLELIQYDLPYPYIDGLILRSTQSIGKINVLHEARREGKSGYTLKKLISLWMNMFTNFSILPLRFSSILGFVFAVLGFLVGIFSIIEKILNPDLPQGYASIIALIAVLSGVQMITIGMLGEYLGRVFLSQNKTPQYTIKKRFVNDQPEQGK